MFYGYGYGRNSAAYQAGIQRKIERNRAIAYDRAKAQGQANDLADEYAKNTQAAKELVYASTIAKAHPRAINSIVELLVTDTTSDAIAKASARTFLGDHADFILEQYAISEALRAAEASKPVVGIYRKGGTIYRVRQSRSTSNLYAERYTPQDDGGAKFEYVKGAISSLSISDRLTKDEADALSLQVGNCLCCGRLLTAEVSVSRGIGPVCAKRYF